MNDFRIVFMGTPKFASDVLIALLKSNFNIVGVVSQPDKEVGRKKVLTPSITKTTALKYNIPVLTPYKVKDDFKEIIDLNPDLIITCAYGQIIPNELINYPKFKCINIHGSLLPYGRGGAPIQHALMDGLDYTGITIMHMNDKMDEGDILVQDKIKIDDKDTYTILFDKLAKLASNLLTHFLPKYFNGDYKAIKQDSSSATYTYNIKKEDEFISFNDSCKNVYNHIRALLDEPGCYFVINNKRYKILSAFYEIRKIDEPNLFVGLFDNYLRINCIDGFIKIYTIKPEGKNEMDAKAFFNGVGKSLVNLKTNINYE